jgi:putative glutamine amidotransferase
MRVESAPEYYDPRDALSQAWLPFLQSCDITPVLVPNICDAAISLLEKMDMKGVILSGGNNVCPKTYGADSNHTIPNTAPERDATETALIEWAVEAGLPIFGVCRGMHMLNAHFGGTILTDLKAQTLGISHHVACEHEVRLTLSWMTDMFGCKMLLTNSYHNQGITQNELASPLECGAIAVKDGIIEAVVHRELPIVGIQWHPERGGGSSSFDKALLRSLFVKGDFCELKQGRKNDDEKR